MTIEALLERMAVALEKQTASIEAYLAKAQTLTVEKSTTRAKKEKVEEPPKTPESPKEEKKSENPPTSSTPAASVETKQQPHETAAGSAATAPVAEPPKKPTVEMIRTALYNVQKVKGAEIARNIVVKVGNAEMVTKILEDKYPLVLQACEEALK